MIKIKPKTLKELIEIFPNLGDTKPIFIMQDNNEVAITVDINGVLNIDIDAMRQHCTPYE